MAVRKNTAKRMATPKPVRSPVTKPVSRFQAFRSRLAKTVSTTRRKVAAVGLAGALAFGTYGIHKGYESYQYHHAWRQNADIAFQYADHETLKHADPIEQRVIEAQRMGKPFQVLAVESGITTTKEKATIEARDNEVVRNIRSAYGSAITRESTDAIAQIVHDQVFQKASLFTCKQYAIAAKYGLKMKLAEAYPNQIELLTKTKIYFQMIDTFRSNTFQQQSTTQVTKRISDLLQQISRYEDFRNQQIAQTVDSIAAEIRKESPALRGERLRVLVSLGTAHARAGTILSKKKTPTVEVTQFPISEEIQANLPQFIVSVAAAKHGTEKNFFENHTGMITISALIQPYYFAQGPTKALAIYNKVSSLTEREAQSLLDRVNQLTGEAREKELVRTLGI